MAIADQLKHKWDGITPRERGLVVLLGVCAPAIILLWMGLQISDRLDSLADQNKKMRAAVQVLDTLRANGGPTQAAAGPEANIGPEPVRLESYLNAEAQKVSISVPGYKAKQPDDAKGNGYMMHTVEFQVNALDLSVASQFLEAVETDNRLVVVTEMMMKKSFQDPKKVDLKLSVSTFYKPADAGAGSGTGSSSGSSSASAAPAVPPT